MIKRKLNVILLATALTLLGAACGAKKTVTPVTTNTSTNVPLNVSTAPSNSGTTGDFSTSGDTTNTTATTIGAVSIENMSFSPQTLSVKKGATVTWTNNDAITHTVTGDTGGPSNTGLAPGGTYSFTFNAAGIFKYHCAIHPTMTGTVTVTE